MKKYVVSVVMTKVIPCEHLALNGSKHLKQAQPDISIQNVVGITRKATTPEEAVELITASARRQHPDHKVTVRVVVEADAEDMEG